MAEQLVKGSEQERKLFTDVSFHYQMAKEDLDARLPAFNKADELVRSYINESGWPYRALVFDPRVFTALFEKTSRLFANKPRGRLIPREGGDALGAKVNNELLSFQWDDNERVDNQPMIAKWAQMDINARKYGASFALVKWQYQTKNGKEKREVVFDGPNFKPLINRDCLPNPSYSSIKNWFQHRDYVTLQELEETNDAARSKPVYKNLDILRDSLQRESSAKGKGGDKRDWQSKNLSIKGITDQLGSDPTFKVVELVTEYREDRWVTFAPKHGVILRDIDNPYDHGQIPVVMLRYYQVDDDLYGLSEIEPVEKLQKAINALVCQYLDAINMSLYRILKVRNDGSVEMHTLRYEPGANWLMRDPNSDVIEAQHSAVGVTEFGQTYRFLVGAMQEGLGETSAAVSNMVPGESKKTATEITDLSFSRNVRDNFNQVFSTEAIKKQMMFWHQMNQQFLFSDPSEKVKIVRVVGKDAIRYFEEVGLDKYGLTEETALALAEIYAEGGDVLPQEFEQPLHGVQTKEGNIPKFVLEPKKEFGYLVLEKEDLSGTYDYIPDIESMGVPDNSQIISARKSLIDVLRDPSVAQALMTEGYRLKAKELLEDYFEPLGLKDAEKYFERLPESPAEGGLNAAANIAGGGGPQAGALGGEYGQPAGMGAGVEAALGVQNPASMARPA